jgi:RNA polymerase sigma-70 factor (ECF subfamily)
VDPVTRTPLAPALIDGLVADAQGRLPMNEQAFVDFYTRTAGPVAGYLRRLTGNRAVAEDLLQETYLRFLGASRLPEADDHQKHYLFRIATNLARDHFRAERRRARVPLDRQELEAFTPDTVHAADRVHRLLGRLSSRDRELLLLAYVEGLTHQQIGQVTGLMRASVKPLLFRARRRFAAVLRQAGVPESSGPER